MKTGRSLVAGVAGVVVLAGCVAVVAAGQNSAALWSDITSVEAVTVALCEPAAGPSPIVAVETSHSGGAFALDADGGLWAWGINEDGASGTGSGLGWGLNVLVPTPVVASWGGQEVTAVVGRDHRYGATSSDVGGYAIVADGSLWAWGWGYGGALGNGASADSDVPVQVTPTWGPDARVVTVEDRGRGDGAFVLLDNGQVWGWGTSGDGALGDGSIGDGFALTDVPVQVTPVWGPDARVVDVHAREVWGGTVLLDNGQVWTWGHRVGSGTGEYAWDDPYFLYVPVQVVPAWGMERQVVQLAVTGDQNGYVLLDDGQVWGWGMRAVNAATYGVLGDGSTDSFEATVPVQVVPSWGSQRSIVQVVAVLEMGGGYGLADDGSVWAWGNAAYGRLGDGIDYPTAWGQYAGPTVPVQVVPAWGPHARVVEVVSAGRYMTYALVDDGSLWSWGMHDHNNGAGLGHGIEYAWNQWVSQPVQVSAAWGSCASVVGFAPRVFDEGGFVVLDNGEIWGWGDAHYGSLGNGIYSDWREIEHVTAIKVISSWLGETP